MLFLKNLKIELRFIKINRTSACSMPIVTNADCDGKLPIATLHIITV
jgi:hypothetical protein